MAEQSQTVNWEVNEHEIFKEFRKKNKRFNVTPRNIADVKNDLYYLYDFITGNILVTRVSSLINRDASQRYQIYEPDIRVRGKVKNVRVSENSVQLALFTTNGLYVVELPHIWSCCMTPGVVASTDICKLWMILPIDNLMHSLFSYEVLQAKWHIGISYRLLVLFNDNYLRLYNTETRSLEKILSLGRHPQHLHSTVFGLGEHAVDFEFIPKKSVTHTVWCDKVDAMNYPILILRADGNVLIAHISKEVGKITDTLIFRCSKVLVNSYTQALLVLPTEPTLIIIAHCNGAICHYALVKKRSQPCLRLIEKAVLEVVEGTGKTPIRHITLMKDPGSELRYYALHEKGVHVFEMRIGEIFEKIFSDTTRKYVRSEVRAGFEKATTNLYYLICTKIPDEPNSYPLYAVSLIPGRSIKCRLLVIFGDAEVSMVSVDVALMSGPNYQSRNKFPHTEKKKDFVEVIKEVLYPPSEKCWQKKLEEVQLRLKGNTSENVLEELRECITIIKEDVVKKTHEKAMQLINAKTLNMEIYQGVLCNMVENFKQDKDLLKLNAEWIAERYEEQKEKHAALEIRMAEVNVKIQEPFKTLAEIKMRGEVKDLYAQTQDLKMSLDRAQAVVQYYKSKDIAVRQESQQNPVYLNDWRRITIFDNLTMTTDGIRKLKEKIEAMRSTLNELS